MRRYAIIAAAIVALGVLCRVMPPFRIVSLKQAQSSKEQGTFQAAAFAARFWNEHLTPALSKAADAQIALAALTNDPKTAATNYGRTIGLSDTVYYFIRGTGTVVSVGDKGVGISLRGGGAAADLQFKTGLLFGNTIRDATGLLDASAFPNSQNFNDVSTELNAIVETQVLPKLKSKAAVGQQLRFVGCAEVSEEDAGERPLPVIPVFIEFQ